jgi:hypothetical protein
MLENPRPRITSDPLAIVVIAAVVFSAISIYELRDFDFPRDLHAACSAILKLAPDTGVTAIKVWSFWAWSALLVAAFIRRLDPDVEWFDSSLIGIAGVWVLAYFAGTFLGPLGLFRGPTLWIGALAATFYLYPNISVPQFRRPSFGLGLAFIAIALAAVSLLPLQLGSPVAPYMDVLSWPASAQRILTFGRYLPFDNDPYGIFGPNVQQPGLELFYAYLALGSHTKLAVLAESSLIFPIAALTILAIYRLGTTLFGEVTGGAAALLLFLTTIFRWLEGMRGTAVDFVLVALGLALFMDPRRSRTLMASGALMLAVALPSHAIDGALALGVASAVCASWLLSGDFARFRAGAVSIAGASLVGVPEIAIAKAMVVPTTVMILAEIAGVALIIYGASLVCQRDGDVEPRVAVFFARALLVIVAAAAIHDVVRGGSLYEEVTANFVLLGILALAGLAAIIIRPPSTDTVGRLCAISAILLPPLAIVRVLAIVAPDASASAGFVNFELTRKIADYWMPFAMIFPAARLAGLGCELLPKAAVMTGLLALMIFPPPGKLGGFDYYTHEHSIGENWMIDFSILSNGYWTLTNDSRWTASPTELRLFEVIRGEIAAGRLISSTHILHRVHDVSPYAKWARFSVFTGVDDDPLVLTPAESEWPMFLVGGRVKSIIHFKEELAKRPTYILSEIPLTESITIPAEYEPIFDSGGIILYRRSPSR